MTDQHQITYGIVQIVFYISLSMYVSRCQNIQQAMSLVHVPIYDLKIRREIWRVVFLSVHLPLLLKELRNNTRLA